MKCPKCGEEMKDAYVCLGSGYPSALYLTKEEPRGSWFWGETEEKIGLLQRDVFHRDKREWSHKVTMCGKCGIILFVTDKRLPARLPKKS